MDGQGGTLARWGRALVRRLGRYSYVADGIAVAHASPCLEDRAFAAAYRRLVAPRLPAGVADTRWRAWMLVAWARQAAHLGGAFAEFGTYRGASAALLLTFTPPCPDRRCYLFDTFAGIPPERLTARERAGGFTHRLADTSADAVRRLLQPWREQVVFVVGDVFETLGRTETGPLAFVHLDLNAAAATARALAYAYTRLLPGGVLVFDDYGWTGFESQRAAVDGFFADKPEGVIALPTGQALVIKLPR